MGIPFLNALRVRDNMRFWSSSRSGALDGLEITVLDNKASLCIVLHLGRTHIYNVLWFLEVSNMVLWFAVVAQRDVVGLWGDVCFVDSSLFSEISV